MNTDKYLISLIQKSSLEDELKKKTIEKLPTMSEEDKGALKLAILERYMIDAQEEAFKGVSEDDADTMTIEKLEELETQAGHIAIGKEDAANAAADIADIKAQLQSQMPIDTKKTI